MENEQFEEGQIVLCTVERIIGTTVFVKVEDNEEGTITTSEIAPGRIRNLRDYVVPGKKVVCKILSIREGKIQLSLRRVKPSEKKELLEKIAKETSYKAILKTVLGEKSKEIIEKITGEFSMSEFFEKIKENPKILEDYINKENAEKIIKIIESKREKPKEIKHTFKIFNKSSNGIVIVKKILQDSCKNSKCDITYLAAGKYLLIIKGENFKKMKTEINKTLKYIEEQSKKQNCEFSVEK